MELIKKIWAAMVGAARPPIEIGDATPQEEAAWSEYRSSWEMDPPPDPRSVFLAGYRSRHRPQSF